MATNAFMLVFSFFSKGNRRNYHGECLFWMTGAAFRAEHSKILKSQEHYHNGIDYYILYELALVVGESPLHG
jgi:hypothetical protein